MVNFSACETQPLDTTAQPSLFFARFSDQDAAALRALLAFVHEGDTWRLIVMQFGFILHGRT
jgi:hypothetical protein